MLYPDLIIHNARIFTADHSRSLSTAMACYDGRIVAVGDESITDLAGPKTERIALGGRTVLPGLCDAHIHLFDWLLLQNRLDLSNATSRSEMLSMLSDYSAKHPPDAWIIGSGWNESRWGEQHYPTIDEINARAGEHPTLLFRSDLHVAIANQAALQQANITAATPDPEHGVIDRDATGKPTGILRELATQLVSRHIPQPSPAEMATLWRAQVRRLHALGITAVHDQRMKDGTEGPIMLAAYQTLRAQEQLLLRVNTNLAAHQLPELVSLGMHTQFGDNWLRLGHIKVFADGSLGSRTAWMLAPFVKDEPTASDNFGVCVTPPEQMAAEFRTATDHGFPISVHAIGDRANRTVLDLFAKMKSTGVAPRVPHRIEHVQTLDPADVARLAELDITASVQPIHLLDDRELADQLLGGRSRSTYAFNALLSSGARLVFGSDAPVAAMNPFEAIHAALTRRRPGEKDSWYPDESISLPQALLAYTQNAAIAGGWQTTIGSLTVGKQADFIVLDRDIFSLAESESEIDAIASTEVLLTVVGGEIVHDSSAIGSYAPQNYARTIIS